MKESNFLKTLLSENQAKLFELFATSQYDFLTLAKCYMKSNVCKYIDSDFSSYHNATPKLIFECLLDEFPDIKKKHSKVEYNLEAARWLGYFYRQWKNITGETSRKIVSQLIPIEGLRGYFNYHQMNEDYAIEMCKRRYNLKRSSHRLYESKKRTISLDDLDSQSLLSLCKNLLVKLYNTKEIKSLGKFVPFDTTYDLLSESHRTGVIVNKVKYHSQEIYKTFKKENENLMFSRFTAENSIIFFFLENTKSINDVAKKLDPLKEFYFKGRTKFDNVFVFCENTLFQIEPMFQLTKYNLGSCLSKIAAQSKRLDKTLELTSNEL